MNGVKRHINTCSEDDFSEDGRNGDDYCVGSTQHHMSGGGGGRKRRRGVIEKRRRDRINHSLNELKRLVPTALEKSGSAKLEKAEILQMTVDHLKMLQSRGMNGYDYDPQRLAMDYHNIGFRECAAEVARYLMTSEGMDAENPLRIRLVSHLQMFATSRVTMTTPSMHHHNPYSTPNPHHSSGSWTSTQYTPPACAYGIEPEKPNLNDSNLDVGYFSSSPASTRSPVSVATPTSSSTPTTTQAGHGSYQYSGHFSFSQMPSSTPQSYPSNKPYRPWGAEMAC